MSSRVTARTSILAGILVFSGLGVLLVGCDTPPQGIRFAREDEFAQGAFPPVLSDMDYHQKSWRRNDCLTCHVAGVREAPLIRHSSLPPEAMQSKCRTCHVLVPGVTPAG